MPKLQEDATDASAPTTDTTSTACPPLARPVRVMPVEDPASTCGVPPSRVTSIESHTPALVQVRIAEFPLDEQVRSAGAMIESVRQLMMASTSCTWVDVASASPPNSKALPKVIKPPEFRKTEMSKAGV